MNDIIHCSCGEVLRSEVCWLLHKAVHPDHRPTQVDRPPPKPVPADPN